MHAVYEKQGREGTDKMAQGGMDDRAGFIAAVFGGECFYDYVRAPSRSYRKSSSYILQIRLEEYL